MNIEPVARLLKWFLPLLIRRDGSTTHAEIIRRAKKILDPYGAAVVMALWRVVVHKFTQSPVTYKLLSNLEHQYPSPDSVERFFKKLEDISHKVHDFAITLDYLYHSSERVDQYFVRHIKGRLAGDISTDAPPPKKR